MRWLVHVSANIVWHSWRVAKNQNKSDSPCKPAIVAKPAPCSTYKMVTLKEKQISEWLPQLNQPHHAPNSLLFAGAIKQMLNLNQAQSSKTQIATEPVWKILIYDRVGQDIISPLISIKELRELGVTLHV